MVVLGSIASIVTVIALTPVAWGVLKRPFAKTRIDVEYSHAQFVGPLGHAMTTSRTTPGAIAIPPSRDPRSNRTHKVAIDSIDISPASSQPIDIRADLGYNGRIDLQGHTLATPFAEFHMRIANRSTYPESCVTLTEARIVVDGHAPLYLGDRQTIVITGVFNGRGGGGGFSLETTSAFAILDENGVRKRDEFGIADGHRNLIKSQAFGLNPGDIRIIEVQLCFATSGRFELHLEIEGTDERGRPIRLCSDRTRANIIVVDAEYLRNRNPVFMIVKDDRFVLAD